MPGGFGDLPRINYLRDAEAQGEARLSQSKILSQTDRKENVEESEKRAKWRVNILALVGVAIGIVAIFSAWIRWIFGDYNLINILNEAAEPEYALMFMGCFVFLIGTLFAIFIPMGGIIQLVGIPMFIIGFISYAEGRFPSGIGPYLGIASAIILVISIIKPIGLNYKPPIELKGRLLTFSKAPEPLPSPDEIPQSPLSKESTPQKSSISKDDGLKIVLHCSQCGKPTDGGAFCKHCGAKLG
ncbi:MAG: hypothetical protein OEV21_01205 [Thermoplasmata archaeon]|nr:hypothetical protein [Thermoplasmata archaeon]